MEAKPFHGSKLKIARAETHISELADKIPIYLARDPFAVFREINTDTGKDQVSMRGREEVPDEFIGIFGDAVHNLRAALDILANDLVALSGVTPKKVYFPFGRDPDSFEDQLSEKMAGAKPDILNVIRGFKPFPAAFGGNEFLRSLHDLDIQDKHIAIIRPHLRASVTVPLVQIENENPEAIATFKSDFAQLKTVKIDTTGYKLPPNIKLIGKVADIPTDLVIAPDFPLQDYPVLAALDGMSDAAKCVVETLETHCLGSE